MGAARRNAGHAGGARDAKRAPRRAPSAFKRQAYFALEDVRRGNAVVIVAKQVYFADPVTSPDTCAMRKR